MTLSNPSHKEDNTMPDPTDHEINYIREDKPVTTKDLTILGLNLQRSMQDIKMDLIEMMHRDRMEILERMHTLKNEVQGMSNSLFLKLGGVIIGCSTIIGALVAIFR